MYTLFYIHVYYLLSRHCAPRASWLSSNFFYCVEETKTQKTIKSTWKKSNPFRLKTHILIIILFVFAFLSFIYLFWTVSGRRQQQLQNYVHRLDPNKFLNCFSIELCVLKLALCCVYSLSRLIFLLLFCPISIRKACFIGSIVICTIYNSSSYYYYHYFSVCGFLVIFFFFLLFSLSIRFLKVVINIKVYYLELLMAMSGYIVFALCQTLSTQH